ncbi:hypothetical protein E8E14_008727 [Neopestalotiopsis sp. 37M]|nr:hypothetical protein E8E14_008727 [Neopestalotiopsis sp. 37M]
MRTRKSNKAKRFDQQAYLSELGSSDEEDLRKTAQRQDSDSDDGFVDDPADAGAADDDDKFDNTELVASSESDEGEVLSDIEKKPRRRPRPDVFSAKIKDEKDGKDRAGKRSLGEVQPYPGEPSMKWTRSYIGPVSRHVHLGQLCAYWYGDRNDFRKIISSFILMWTPYDLFPPKLVSKKDQRIAKGPWSTPTFWEDQQKKLVDWYFNYLSTRKTSSQSQILQQSIAQRWFIPKAETALTAFLGPHNHQNKHTIYQGQSIPLSPQGSPSPGEAPSDEATSGWLLDVGGITLAMDWAPRAGPVDQLLAMTVIPYSDQAFYQTPEEAPPDESKKQGSIQIWAVPAQKGESGTMTFKQSQPNRVASLCLDGWGRVVRMQWCPVPLTVGNLVGLLAFLTADGILRVVEVKQSWSDRNRESFEEIREAFTTLELKSEYKVDITSFTWVNMNRICVGCSDGSLAVWSLYPCVLLQRHPVHSSPVLDVKSGYPSHPFIVASAPTGGVTTVTDLNRPNAELVYVPNLIVNFQPNLLVWSEHMRGFISLWASSSPANIALSFMSIRTWPQSRFVVAISGQPSCMAIGSCHPYLLVGSTDGSLWLSNPFRRVFYFKKKHRKIKLFHHEYQALATETKNAQEGDEEVPRGVCRILHGFKPIENAHPRHDKSGVQMRQRHNAQKKKEQQKRKKTKKPKGKGKQGTADDDFVEDDELGSDMDQDMAGRGSGDVVNCDPLTRITSVAWNPNIEFSWWAAAAMGSGLVRIMDLGEEQASKKTKRATDTGDETSEMAEEELAEDVDDDEEDVPFDEADFADEASDVSMEDYD